jgi:hypothetical protein
MQKELNDWLWQAVMCRDLKNLAQALAQGADARARSSWALRVAAQFGDVESLKNLIPASDPLAMGSYALAVAARNGHEECVRMLMPVSEKLTEAAAEAREEGHMEVAGMIEAFIESQALSGAVQKAKMNPRTKSAL